MAENVRVVVRCRPMNAKEYTTGCQNIIKIEKCTLCVLNPLDVNAPPKAFTFDNVYGDAALTESIYQDICYALVENVLEGYNGTIFAYGQTGCGKTHTMQGTELEAMTATLPATPSTSGSTSTSSDNDRGIIVRCFEHIFETIALARNVRYLAIISYLEIYNENIRDLLQAPEQQIVNHQLKELPNLGVVVPTLSTHTVTNAHECYQLLLLGNRNRMVAATMMNATSSRSHTIFTIYLEQIALDAASTTATGTDITTACDDSELSLMQNASSIRCGKLNLVDLAGSERQNKTGAVGERLREAMKINLSLSALGNVISALVDGKTKHIPYRDSKLTRLLQDSLGGNTKTLMISCISPAACNYDETISTLRYASRAKNIANKPRINEDPKDAKLREYQEEINKLRVLLQQATITTAVLSEAVPENISPLINATTALPPSNNDETYYSMEPIKVAPRQQQHQEEQSLDPQVKGVMQDHNHHASAVAEPTKTDTSTLQLETRKRIEAIKRTLIGGELANDAQLRARRQKKKLDAQRRLSALAHALSRVVQREDRDFLQVHYANTQQEIEAKNAQLKEYRQRIRALETEVADVQAEFQVDRVDYLDAIRKLERNLKFYQQLIDKALPILRKMGKYWDPDDIIRSSSWNDDLKIWILPESTLNNLKFPPANGRCGTATTTFTDTATSEHINNGPHIEAEMQQRKASAYIINNYFRTPRIKFNNDNLPPATTSITVNSSSSHFSDDPNNNTSNNDSSISSSNSVHFDKTTAQANTKFVEQYFQRSNILHTVDREHRDRARYKTLNNNNNNGAATTTTPASASITNSSNWFKMQQMANKLPHSAWHRSAQNLTAKPYQQRYNITNLLHNTWSGRNNPFMLLPPATTTASSTHITPIQHTLYQNRQSLESNSDTEHINETTQNENDDH